MAKHCENYELCGHEKVPEMGSPFCMTCGSWFKVGGFGWDKLAFRDTQNVCVICMEFSGREIKFPACEHYFCVKCSKNILFWDETRYHLSPVPYGCPPCPNGCENPIKGRQCDCIENYGENVGESDNEATSIVEKWRREHPEQYKEWNDAEHISIEDSMTSTEDAYASGKCPLCRSKYTREH